MSEWGTPQGSSYYGGGYSSGGRKRGRDDEEEYSNYDYRDRAGSGYGQRRRVNTYERNGGGRGYGSGGGGQYNTPYYGSRYDNVMRIKQDLWKCLESEGSRFKSQGEPRAAGSRHGISREQYESIRKALEDNWMKNEQCKLDVLTVFAVAVNELPHKHAYFATFLALLHAKPTPSSSTRKPEEVNSQTQNHEREGEEKMDGAESGKQESDKDSQMDPASAEATNEQDSSKSTAINVALEVIKHLDSNLGLAVSQSEWRSVRFHLRFFALCAHLLPTALIAPESLVTVLHQLADLLKKGSLSIAVRDEVALAVGETLLLLPLADQTSTLRQSLKDYQTVRKIDNATVLFSSGYVDHIDALCDLVLTPPEESPFVNPFKEIPDLVAVQDKPPQIPLSSLEESLATSTLKTDSLPRVYLRFFDDETTPGPSSGASYLVRSLTMDLMELLEPSRKECARLLLELGHGHFIVGGGRWFKPKKSKEEAANEMDTDQPKGTWLLDNTIVELLLSSLFASPFPVHPTIYYTSLLVELCKLSPMTVAPAMGKCVRRAYGSLGAPLQDGAGQGIKLDGEGLRRFAEWFGVHLSNFNFTWRWPEWQGDLSLPTNHPKRVLIDRILELEVRLSYFDRIKDTLPDTYKEALPTFQGSAPLPKFDYESKENPNTPHADAILALIRGKAPVEDINEKSEAFVKELVSERGLSEDEAHKLSQNVTIQCALLLGSKSFSHFLNLLERYLHLFRSLSSTTEKRQSLVSAVWAFFGPQKQLGLIVLDKFLRYRILDPKDVVEWLFNTDTHIWSDLNTWDMLTNTIEVAQSRIANASTKLDQLRSAAAVKAAQEEENKQKAADEATGGEEMQVDAQEVKPEVTSSDEIRSLEKQVLVLQDSLTAMLLQSAKGFAALVGRSEEEWAKWWAVSWTSQFGKQFGAKLHKISGMEEVVNADNEAGRLFKAAMEWHKFVTR